MKVEVINTGTEILLGNVINTHLAFLAQELFKLGLRVERQVTVSDGYAIREALAESFSRADFIFITGGLGPTTDDVTREIIAEMLDLPLIHDAEVMDAILTRFARRGLTMTDRVPRQAEVPRGATVLPNGQGTAPGLYLQPATANGLPTPHIFLLPGPPRELKPMFIASVLPILRGLVPGGVDLVCRTLRVTGLGESSVEEMVGEQLLAISGLELGYCARPGEVDVRCIGTAEIVAQAEAILLPALGEHVVSSDERSLEQVVLDALVKQGKTVAVAESCTGGAIANALTNIPGASASFLAGLVTYANSAKTAFLGVEPALLEAHGAVSAPVAAAMAEGALKKADADFAIATTGIAGPGGGTPEKPVGTVFIGLATRDAPAVAYERHYPTSRDSFKHLVTQAALDLLRRAVG
jgi:nicotinamide-nucleotide amidase